MGSCFDVLKKKLSHFKYFYFIAALLMLGHYLCPQAYALQGGVTEYFGLGPSSLMFDGIGLGGGEYRRTWKLHDLGGPLPLNFTLVYAPDLERKRIYNNGRTQFPPYDTYDAFTSNTIIRIVGFQDWSEDDKPGYVNVLMGDDVIIFKEENVDSYKALGPVPYQLIRKDFTYFMMDPIKNLVYIFQGRAVNENLGSHLVGRCGEVYSILDRNNNLLSFEYYPDNNPISINDDYGNSISLSYGSSSDIEQRNITSVMDVFGRKVPFDYKNLMNNWGTVQVLNSFISKDYWKYTFTYYDYRNNQCNLFGSLLRPLTNEHYVFSWKRNGLDNYAVGSRADALGNSYSINYSMSGDDSNVVVIDPNGISRSFTHYNERYPLTLYDEAANQCSFAYDDDNRLIQMTDRLGDSIHIEYHDESGKPSKITNTIGLSITYSYSKQTQQFVDPTTNEEVDFDFYNLTRIDYPDSTYIRMSYDSKGNLVTRTDRTGRTWSYTYEDMGNILTITNPEEGVTTYSYYNNGAPYTVKDSDTSVTIFEYDQYKRLQKVTSTNGKYCQVGYDVADRIVSFRDESSALTKYEYDYNGNIKSIIDPSEIPETYFYDDMDRINSIRNRMVYDSSYAYSNRGKLGSYTEPSGVKVEFDYEKRNWISQVSINDAFWIFDYSNEGSLLSRESPMRNKHKYAYDKCGRVVGYTDPELNKWTFSRNAVGLVSSIVDPLAQKTQYTYDGNGNISSVILPDGSSTSFKRSGLGHIKSIYDAEGNTWLRDYTDMGNVSLIKDPLGNARTYEYDKQGRVSTIIYADQGTQAIQYTDTGLVSQRNFLPEGNNFQYTYNQHGRLTKTGDYTFSYDTEGRLIDTEFGLIDYGVEFDPSGRLKTVDYNGIFSVDYEYDSQTGLLTRVHDDLTNTEILFTHDEDRRIRKLERSNNVDTLFTWDKHSRITAIETGNIIDLQYTYDTLGNVVSMNYESIPLDPAQLTDFMDAQSFSYDAASQENSKYTYDKRGRMITDSSGTYYAWNGASHLKTLDGYTITNNELGHPSTKTDASDSGIRYYYNYSLPHAPVVAEADADTDLVLRYYICSPSGDLLYMIDAENGDAVYFFHYDQTGSTIALTDEQGDVAASYAYSPYGRLLSSTGSVENPFTFSGRWGVMQMNNDGSVYRMQRRYYHAELGAFMTRTPEKFDPAKPRRINPYQYAENNPVRKGDVYGVALDRHNVAEPYRFLEYACDAGEYLYDVPRTYEMDAIMASQVKRMPLETVSQKLHDLPLFTYNLHNIPEYGIAEHLGLRETHRLFNAVPDPMPKLKLPVPRGVSEDPEHNGLFNMRRNALPGPRKVLPTPQTNTPPLLNGNFEGHDTNWQGSLN